MGRPADWSPLAASDPVPGDAQEVAALGRRFRATAGQIQQSAKQLRTMCTDEFWDSDAGAAFRQRSDDTAGKLDKAFGRYDAAATALGNGTVDARAASTAKQPQYASALQHAQDLSRKALTNAQDADATRRQALAQIGRLASAPVGASAGSGSSSAGSGSGTSALASPLKTDPGATTADGSGHLPSSALDTPEIASLKRTHNAAVDELSAARGLLAQAEQIRDTAASNASSLISGVIGSDGLTDGFWDHVTNFIDEHAGLLSMISRVAGWVATICGTLALVVGWIPIVGQALAAVLGTVALIASVVTLIADVLLLIGGKGSLFDVVLDVIAVASFGLGRAATGALKDSSLLARVAGKAEMYKGAESELMASEDYLQGGEKFLKNALPEAWNTVEKAVGELPREEVTQAVAHAPGAWPKWGDVLRGFNPVSILKDGFQGLRELRPSQWAKLADSGVWKDTKFVVGDPDIHEALDNMSKLDKNIQAATSVRSFVANVASNHNMWRFATVPAVAVDWTNHILTETGLKDPFLKSIHMAPSS